MTQDKFVIKQGLFDMEPISCGREECAPGHSYGPAIREYYLLHFVISGRGIFTTDRGSYGVRKNQMFIIRPNEVTFYEADLDRPWEYIWLGFTARAQLPAVLAQEDVVTLPEAKETFLSCHDEPDSHTGGVGYEAFLCARLWELLRLLWQRERYPAPTRERYVQSALNIMETEYDRELTVAHLADRLHLHRGYLSQIFREGTGRSPAHYLNDIRMERAVDLLCRRRQSVSVTALSVGFADVFSFSRAFKRYYGVAPSEYAKNDGNSKGE